MFHGGRGAVQGFCSDFVGRTAGFGGSLAGVFGGEEGGEETHG